MTFSNGLKVFRADQAANDPVFECSSPWYNIDGMGIAVLSSSGSQRYLPLTPRHYSGRLEQILHLNHPSERTLKPTVLVIWPDQNAAATPQAAGACAVKIDRDRFVVTLEDQTEVTADLRDYTIAIKR